MEVVGPLPGSAGELLGVLSVDGAEPLPVRLVPVPDHVAGDPELLAQLRRGAAAAAELVHPNILRTFGIEDVQGTAMQVLADVQAHTLRAVIETGGRLPPSIAARVLLDVCAAVQFARDKERGGSRLLGDLCLDTVLVAESGATLVAGLGVPPPSRPSRDRLHLLSPEQIVAGAAAMTSETDVYLLGLLFHACLAGEPPFAEEADPEASVLTKPPPSLSAPGIPEPLAEAVARALAKKTQDRFRSPEAFAEEVSRCIDELAEPEAVAAYAEMIFPPEEQVRAVRRAAAEAAMAERLGASSSAVPQEQTSPPAPQPSASGEPSSSEAKPPGAPPEPALPELDLSISVDTVIEPGRTAPVLDLVSAADIVGEGSSPGIPADLVSAADIVGEGSSPGIPADLVSTADTVGKETSPGTEAGDLVSTADIVGKGALPKTQPVDLVSTVDIVGGAESLPEPQPPPAASSSKPPQKRRGGFVAGAAVAVACIAIGFYLSKLGFPEPSPPAGGSTAGASADPRPAAGAEPIAAAAPAPPLAPPGPPQERTPAPEVPPKSSPPAAAHAARASLDVWAEPPGSIYVDGKLAGQSPLVRPVSRGLHRVRLYDPTGGVDVTRTVNVRGSGARLRFALGKGTVTITAPGGASILIDGRMVATTEVRDLPLWEGDHRLVVTLGAARHTHTFQLRAGETYNYEVSRTTPP
jgi:hypothetical protein